MQVSFECTKGFEEQLQVEIAWYKFKNTWSFGLSRFC